MKITNVKEKLESIGVELSDVCLGDFDFIGEFCAKRQRANTDPNYKKHGAFYRSSYERGILQYYLVKQFGLRSMLEIGFGRGFSTFCVAKAFYDMGIDGTIVTVDPNFDQKFIGALTQVFPAAWFRYVKPVQGLSHDVVPKLEGSFDLIYIDGDHSYEATKHDWEMTKDRFNSFLIFDDYHMPSKDDPGIKCSQAIDEIVDHEKELIIMDRRIFFDDRRLTDDQIDYGQVLVTKQGVGRDDW